MRIYFGFYGWGWRMYGIGYKTLWFLGFSIKSGTVGPVAMGEVVMEGE